ncbi:MAG: hypothetical protein ABSF48_30350, partial [Thermodesulfobacteriota bacterium]
MDNTRGLATKPAVIIGGGARNFWLGFGGVQFKGGQWSGRARGQSYSGSFSWQDDQAIANLKKLQPSVIINNRTNAPADFSDREGDKALVLLDGSA